MNYKQGTEGTLNMEGHFLTGTKAKFIKRNPNGTANVELMEDIGAYRNGDVMVVGPGEWKPKGMNHEDALNIILSHNCPNGHHFVSGEEEDNGIQGWEFEGHCHIIRIKAKMVSEDSGNPDPANRFRYEIVDVRVMDTADAEKEKFDANHFLNVMGGK